MAIGPVLLLDQDPPHDHPTGRVEPLGLVGNLADPLSDRGQPAKASFVGFLPR